jgi:23S rRNA pseudouridine1911/1915/1917 synthase
MNARHPSAVVIEPSPAARGRRLDVHVREQVGPDVSRARVQAWIEAGAVLVDGARMSSRHRLTGRERIEVNMLPRAADASFEPDPVALAILHSDDAIFVVDKPAGLVVHPAAGNWRNTLLNGLLHAYPAQAALARAGIVHRLDKDTSGLMVVARSEGAQLALVRALAAHRVDRRYVALAEGRLAGPRRVDASIGRDPGNPVRMRANVVRGKAAITQLTPLGTGMIDDDRPVTLVHCRLQTGRTHQIRVHLALSGVPLLGDATYGARGTTARAATLGCGRQALHAWRLSLVHPVAGAALEFESAWPPDFRSALRGCGLDADAMLAAAAVADALPFDAAAAVPGVTTSKASA